MARFAFVSIPAWGHVDFGGQSFLATARALAERGHEVRWLLSRGEEAPQADAVEAHLRNAGLLTERIDGPLSLLGPAPPDAGAVAALAERLVGFDACVVDRLSALAGVAAHRAGVPWAAAGTNGRPWMRVRGRGIFPGASPDAAAELRRRLGVGDYPAPGGESFWAVSPFLNFSFFPRLYYGGAGGEATHFLGAGGSERISQRGVVLVTLGTSFAPERRARMLDLLEAASQLDGTQWRFLVGGSESADGARSWAPYDVAFAEARLAIGHGGNAFLWQAMREGIPVVAISSGVGDQTFGARAAVRLGLGRALESDDEASADWVARAVRELREDPAVAQRAAALRALLHSGGGVPAAAALVEKLARDRAPVTACAAPRCCCVEDAYG